jgi:hypothetical protein
MTEVVSSIRHIGQSWLKRQIRPAKEAIKMIRVGNFQTSILAAIICVMVSFATVGAEEKEISFGKDIQVVPVNEKSDSRINVRLVIDKSKVNPGDTITVNFEADKDCYLTLIDVGTSGKITRIWPNGFSGDDNFVKANAPHSFPGASDKFVFRVSGPEGIERVVAMATAERTPIISDQDFGESKGGFKSYQKGLKDLVVEAAQRVDALSSDAGWGTAEAKVVIGNVPNGGRITSKNVHLLSLGASTMGLKYCDDDAMAFAGLMEDKLKIPKENAVILTGNQATKAAFTNALSRLAAKTQPEDLVLIFFSGHGTLIPDEPPANHADGVSSALICFNTKTKLTRDDPALKDILFSGYQLESLLKKIPARRKMLVIDSCHSGSLTKALGGSLVPKYIPLYTDEELQQIRARSKNLQVVGTGASAVSFDNDMKDKESLLAACSKQESSYEDSQKKAGLFTYWLVGGLKTHQGDIYSAFDKTRQMVLEETSSASQPQTPQLDDDYGLTRDIKF